MVGPCLAVLGVPGFGLLVNLGVGLAGWLAYLIRVAKGAVCFPWGWLVLVLVGPCLAVLGLPGLALLVDPGLSGFAWVASLGGGWLG